jgi:YVTN family beta-propeller protein
MHYVKPLIAAMAMLALIASAPHRLPRSTGTFKIDVPSGPLIGGSRLSVSASGVEGRVAFSVLGPGEIESGSFVAPMVTRKTTTTLIGSTHGAIALKTLEIVPAPPPDVPLLAVATYRNGIALHDPRTFRLIGYVPIGGAPGDVAFNRTGAIIAADTDGDTLATISRTPWGLSATHGVVLGNEVAVDRATGDIYVSDRDAGGYGALTRISTNGTVSRVKTGDTAEGLAIDSERHRIYVGNVNDNSVAVVDAHSLRVLQKIPSVERTFGIALDVKTQRLFVVSNTSPSMPSRAGYVAAIDLKRRSPRIVLRSARMVFPIGAAFDARSGRVFVTDEAKNTVYVLSGKNLRAVHAPLATCDTPWRPLVTAGRLYVPCANADKVDVFNLHTLKRVAGAPFSTGGFPLSVALSQ